jgi:hypothetical protein
MRSSLAMSTSCRTASTMSGEVELRCPRRRRGRRSSVWAPPIQWIRSTISAASASMSAITSLITVRTMRFLRRASVVVVDQTTDVRHKGAWTRDEKRLLSKVNSPRVISDLSHRSCAVGCPYLRMNQTLRRKIAPTNRATPASPSSAECARALLARNAKDRSQENRKRLQEREFHWYSSSSIAAPR